MKSEKRGPGLERMKRNLGKEGSEDLRKKVLSEQEEAARKAAEERIVPSHDFEVLNVVTPQVQNELNAQLMVVLVKYKRRNLQAAYMGIHERTRSKKHEGICVQRTVLYGRKLDFLTAQGFFPGLIRNLYAH